MAALVVRKSTGTETVRLAYADVSIGRDPANDLALPDDHSVSRFHALLVYTEGAWNVRDIGSTNGTYVNSARVSEHILTDGDEIAVGDTRLTFVAQAGRDMSALAPVQEDRLEPDTAGGYLDVGEEWHPATSAPPPRSPEVVDGSPVHLAEPDHPVPAAKVGSPSDSFAVRTDRRPILPIRRNGRSALVRGVARNVQVRQETSYPVMEFRVDSYDEQGDRLPSVGVVVHKFRRGNISEGEEVEARGRWSRGALQARSVRNLSTGADVMCGLFAWEKALIAGAVSLLAIGLVAVLGFVVLPAAIG